MSAVKKTSPRRGAPQADPDAGTRTERVMVRLTPEERAAWEERARDDGRPLGQWIRRQIDWMMAR